MRLEIPVSLRYNQFDLLVVPEYWRQSETIMEFMHHAVFCIRSALFLWRGALDFRDI